MVWLRGFVANVTAPLRSNVLNWVCATHHITTDDLLVKVEPQEIGIHLEASIAFFVCVQHNQNHGTWATLEQSDRDCHCQVECCK